MPDTGFPAGFSWEMLTPCTLEDNWGDFGSDSSILTIFGVFLRVWPFDHMHDSSEQDVIYLCPARKHSRSGLGPWATTKQVLPQSQICDADQLDKESVSDPVLKKL